MRADRLVALLLFLQQRQRVTAAEVAAELEISERTARRDLDALCMAGLPVYSERGRNGGWRLLGGGRTDLSGLTAPEARALFLVAGPASEATPELKAALRKLVRALPETLRTSAETAAATIVLDPQGWGDRRRAASRPHHLGALQEATAEGRQVRLGYADRTGKTTVRVVHPLGLACKGATWYLVGGTEDGSRTFRVSRVRSVELLEAKVVRPEGFDFAEAWREIAERVDEMRMPAEVSVLAEPALVRALEWLFDGRITTEAPGEDGRVPVTVRGARPDLVAAQLAGLGRGVEVVAPAEARLYLLGVGHALVATYAGTDDSELAAP
ncbi:MAG TPA: WYL domain-containing protein [Acidimicrobiales bacterium]|nr:WYL domain-containing protein [Acidimicrobiales bacterium]